MSSEWRRGLPGVCIDCRRPVSWHGGHWYNLDSSTTIHSCPPSEHEWDIDRLTDELLAPLPTPNTDSIFGMPRHPWDLR